MRRLNTPSSYLGRRRPQSPVVDVLDVTRGEPVAVLSYCGECDRRFYVVDNLELHASYRCPVCLMPGTLGTGQEGA
jgi:hypothetical protein